MCEELGICIAKRIVFFSDALSACGLRLAGPFLLLLGRITPKTRTQEFYLTFCRYYYDPPEVQVRFD